MDNSEDTTVVEPVAPKRETTRISTAIYRIERAWHVVRWIVAAAALVGGSWLVYSLFHR